MKSKQQKQQEAIERARKSYQQRAMLWQSCQVGGDRYKELKKKYGESVADARMHQENYSFAIFLVHAKIDSSGNPLTDQEWQLAKDKTIISRKQKLEREANGWRPVPMDISDLIPEGPEVDINEPIYE